MITGACPQDRRRRFQVCAFDTLMAALASFKHIRDREIHPARSTRNTMIAAHAVDAHVTQLENAPTIISSK
jgi:hypothetical protein